MSRCRSSRRKHFAGKSRTCRRARRLAYQRRFTRLGGEWLEPRLMLAGDSPDVISVGRFLSEWSAADVVDNKLKITYTVFNQQPAEVDGVLLTTTLQPGVTFETASQLPDRNGQELAWSLGTLDPFGRASIDVTVTFDNSIPLQLDGGAAARGSIGAKFVGDAANPAMLRADSIDASLLASTPDANSDDPFIRAKAAELNQDASEILAFLTQDVGYESYAGSLRGSRGTLWSSAGNALDQSSLMVAMLRASGIPARYAQGTLSESQAETLILSMFPEVLQTVGVVPPGAEISNPASDANLVAETREHFWVQLDTGGSFQDFDPSFDDAVLGQQFTTLDSTFAEVPNDLRHQTTVRLNRELTNTASALLFGGVSQSVTTVLEVTFPTAELVGRPLTVGQFVNRNAIGTPIFSSITNVYSPYLLVGDLASPSVIDTHPIRGTDFQETITNFPFGTSILTGLNLEIDLTAPDGSVETLHRTLLDLIGFDIRQNGGQPNLTFDPSGPPSLTPFDLWTIGITPSAQSPAPIPGLERSVQESQSALQTLDDALAGSLGGLRLQNALIAQSRLDLVSLLTASDAVTEEIARQVLLTAYHDSPRVTIISTQIRAEDDETIFQYEVDLRRDSIRGIAFPGQNTLVERTFQTARGINEINLEADIAAPVDVPNVRSGAFANTTVVLNAAIDQGIPLLQIDPESPALVDTLQISGEAKARISQALQAGKRVVVPVQNVQIGGESTIAWYELDTETGEIIGVGENGSHQSIVQYGAAITLAVAGLFVLGPALGEITAVIAGHYVKLKADECISSGTTYQGIGMILDPGGKAALIAKCQGEAANLKTGISQQVYLYTPGSSLTGFRQAYDQQIEFMMDRINQYITRTVNARDPAFPNSLLAVGTGDLIPGNIALGETSERDSVSAGPVSGSVNTEAASIEGIHRATWSTDRVHGLQFESLTASGTVRDSSGAVVGAGAVSLLNAAGSMATISGSVSYDVSGDGKASIYSSATTGLGVAAEWNNFSATIQGNAQVALTTGDLMLNGSPLPAGAYTISSQSTTLTGKDSTISANFGEQLLLEVTSGVVTLDDGSGSLTVAGNAANPADPITLTGYTGTVTIMADTGSDKIALSGNASQLIQVSATPRQISADQNTPASFDFTIASSLNDNFFVVVNAPRNWSAELDGNTVTVTPAAGLQGGIFPIEIIVASESSPELTTRTEVMVSVGATSPGVDLEVELDEQYFVPFNGGQIPSAFQASIQNLGPAADTFDLTFNVPGGFEILRNSSSVKVPAGETAILGLYLTPTAPLPAVGTDVSFGVTATSAEDGAISETVVVPFTIPAVHGVTLVADRTSATTLPGADVQFSIDVSAAGNVPEDVSFEFTLPPELAASGLADVSLNAGASDTQVVTFTPSSSVPLNTTLNGRVTANFGGREPVSLDFAITVAAPGATSAGNAAAAAESLGNDELSARLADLSRALTNIVQDPTNGVANSQALASLGSILSLLAVDEILVGFVDPLTAARDQLAAATTTQARLTAVTALGSVLDDFDQTVSNLAAHNFRLFLTPNALVAQPGAQADFAFTIQNVGTKTTTYNLGFSGVPVGVIAMLDQVQVTLDPGEIANVPGSLTQTSMTELLDFDFSIDVTVDGVTPVISKSAAGSMRARREFVSVTSVAANPPFTDAGGLVDVSARLLNAVNRRQEALVSYRVTDPNGVEVFSLSTPVATTLTLQTSLVDVDLGMLDTSGFALGQHTIHVTVTDADGTPIPGASGRTTLLIGSPVTADLTVGPQALPPGTSTVSNTLQISGDAPIGVGSLKLVGMLPISEFIGNFGGQDTIRGVTLNGDVAYVHGNALGIGSLHVVDVSDRTNPTRTRAEIGVVSTSGVVDGNRLLVLDAGTTASGFSNLIAFALNGGSGGTPQDPLQQDSIAVPYIFGQDLDVSGNAAFVSQAQVLFSGTDIFAQNGTVLSFDISDLANLAQLDALLNDNGGTNSLTPNEAVITEMGGDFFMRAAALADANTLLVASSTSTGTDTATGTGRVLVVDVSNPAGINSDNPSVQNAIVGELLIPGTTLLSDIKIVGNTAFVIGSVGGFREGDASDRAPTGDLVVASIDISDPRNPILLHTETLSRAARGALNLTVLNPQWLAITNLGAAGSDTPQLITIDVSDPSRFSFDQQIDLTGEPRGMATDGAFVYVTQSDGLFIYEITNDDPLTLLGTQTVAGARSVAARNDIAYVCGSNGIGVVDYSDAENPSLVRTVSSGAYAGCHIQDDLLLAARGAFRAPFTLDVFSLQSDPLTPVLLGRTPTINYTNLATGLESTNSHAFVTQSQVCFLVGSNDVYVHMGELFSIALNLDNPLNPTSAAPTLESVLFNTFGDASFDPSDVSGCAQSGGDHNVFGLAQPNPQTVYLAASSVVGGNTQAGVGRIQVVDVTDPSNPNLVRNLDIPGTVHAVSISIAGDIGVVIGTTVGWNDPFDGLRNGNLTVTTLNVSDPLNPRIITTRTLARSSKTFWTNLSPLGNGLFAFASIDAESATELNPALLLIDASDPLNPVAISTTDVLQDSIGPNAIAVDGDLLLVADTGGLSTYKIGDIPRIPITASVQIPNNAGVSVVPGSFNLPPTNVVAGPDFDTLVWELTITAGNATRTLTWDTTVTDLRPGESRAVTGATTIDFGFQGTPGQVTLPPQHVFAEQVLALDPAELTRGPGVAAEFIVTIANPADLDVTYDLSVGGVPSEWVDFVSQVTVPAGETVALPLTLTSDPFAPLAEFGFVVTASVDGVSSSVEGTLILAGDRELPVADPVARGVLAQLTPMQAIAGQGTAARYTVRVFNTGSQADDFVLFTTGLPAGFTATFDAGIFNVSPGASNFRDVPLTIVPPPGTTAGDYPFTVTAASTTDVSITSDDAGVLTVLDIGVAVDITPEFGDPNSTLQMMVINTGPAAETFDLSLAGPAALFATLGATAVTLGPGQSQSVEINVGAIDAAVPGTLPLVGVARSRTNNAVSNADRADIVIGETRGLSAEFDEDLRELPTPGSSTFLLLVDNLGNVEDQYSATIMSTSGPLDAALVDPSGRPVTSLPLFVLPGLASGALNVNAQLTSLGIGTVTVMIQSLTEPTRMVEATATLMAEAPRPDFSLDCSPLRVGLNTCTILGGTPGGVVDLALGVQPGDRFLSRFNVSLGMLDPTIVAQGIVQPDGRAVVQFTIATAELLQQVLLQAFEQAPLQRTTNIEIVGGPLRVAGGLGAGAAALDPSVLPALRDEAIRRWQASGLSADELALLRTVSLQITDLAGDILGQTVNETIYLDANAAGHGWYVDTTARDDGEFDNLVSPIERTTTGSPAAHRIDLLTVIMHELGHLLGRDDIRTDQPPSLMTASLPPGTRRLPATDVVAAFQAFDVNGDGEISPIDALLVINHLNRVGAGPLTSATRLQPRLDVNHDGLASPLDAALLINLLNHRATPTTNAEGEANGSLDNLAAPVAPLVALPSVESHPSDTHSSGNSSSSDKTRSFVELGSEPRYDLDTASAQALGECFAGEPETSDDALPLDAALSTWAEDVDAAFSLDSDANCLFQPNGG